MLLEVGELANRCGLTVRTLHHYDAIGLLTPSARSEGGYRLYSRTDITWLHQIQALRRFGLSLADIGALLAKSGGDLSSIVKQQVRVLNQQIEQATTLRDRLDDPRCAGTRARAAVRHVDRSGLACIFASGNVPVETALTF